MRALIIGGVAVACIGAFVFIRGASFTSHRNVLQVGDVKVTATEQRAIPAWAGVLGFVVGAGMVVVGIRRRA